MRVGRFRYQKLEFLAQTLAGPPDATRSLEQALMVGEREELRQIFGLAEEGEPLQPYMLSSADADKP